MILPRKARTAMQIAGRKYLLSLTGAAGEMVVIRQKGSRNQYVPSSAGIGSKAYLTPVSRRTSEPRILKTSMDTMSF